VPTDSQRARELERGRADPPAGAGVGHQRVDPRGREPGRHRVAVRIGSIDDQAVDQFAVDRSDAGDRRLVPGRRHELVGRPLDDLAGDERADRDHRSVGAGDRFPDPGHGEDRADRDHRVRRADHDRLGRRDRRESLGCGLGVGDSLELDPLDRGLPVLGDQVLLDPAPALRGPDAGADRLLGHRQHRRPDTEGPGDLCLSRGAGPTLADEDAPVQAGGEIAV
jgi:hypothetical protein